MLGTLSVNFNDIKVHKVNLKNASQFFMKCY